MLAAAVLSCGDAAPPVQKRLDVKWQAPTPLLVGNQLRNPGFEEDTEGWGEGGDRKLVDFELATAPVHAGHRSAYFLASWQPGDQERPVRFVSAPQEISPTRFPDRVAGWYRVERWEDVPESGILQLQIIVVAAGDPRTPEIVASHHPADTEISPELNNLQVRYQLAGPAEEPDDGGNVKTAIIAHGPPELATWVHFDLPVKSDFERLWGTLPEKYQKLGVIFGVRWDDKPEGAALHADVYYDDLFFGFEDLPDSRSHDSPQR